MTSNDLDIKIAMYSLVWLYRFLGSECNFNLKSFAYLLGDNITRCLILKMFKNPDI